VDWKQGVIIDVIAQSVGIGIITMLCGSLSIFFAYGGIVKRKLFLRLCKMKGKWKRNWFFTMLLTVLISVYGIWLYGFSYEFFAFMFLASYLVAVTITDLRAREIPDDATIFFAVVFLIWNLVSGESTIILDGFFGAAVGGAILMGVYFVRHDAIGLGDVKLLACIGLLTGFPSVMFVLLRAMVFGAIFSIVLLLLKKGTMKTELPFAPFVLLAALI